MIVEGRGEETIEDEDDDEGRERSPLYILIESIQTALGRPLLSPENESNHPECREAGRRRT